MVYQSSQSNQNHRFMILSHIFHTTLTCVIENNKQKLTMNMKVIFHQLRLHTYYQFLTQCVSQNSEHVTFSLVLTIKKKKKKNSSKKKKYSIYFRNNLIVTLILSLSLSLSRVSIIFFSLSLSIKNPNLHFFQFLSLLNLCSPKF